MNKNYTIPDRFRVYTADDVALSAIYGNEFACKHNAAIIASQRGELVYYYGNNGREAVQPAPAVDMGCTVGYIEDRHAATVIAVSPSGSKVTAREDTATRTDDNGMSQSQSYTFERNPSGAVHIFHRQGDGSYATRGKRLTLGVRSHYHCFER